MLLPSAGWHRRGELFRRIRVLRGQCGASGRKLCPEAPTNVLRPASQASTLPGEKKRPSCSHADGDAKKLRVRSRVRKPRLLTRRGRCLSLARAHVWFARAERARKTQLRPHQAVV